MLNALGFITAGIRLGSGDIAIEVISHSSKLKPQFERTVCNLMYLDVRLSLQVSSSSTLVYLLKMNEVEYGLFFSIKGMVYQDLNDTNGLFKQLTKKKLI